MNSTEQINRITTMLSTKNLERGTTCEPFPGLTIRAYGGSFMISTEDMIITREFLVIKKHNISLSFNATVGECKFTPDAAANYLCTPLFSRDSGKWARIGEPSVNTLDSHPTKLPPFTSKWYLGDVYVSGDVMYADDIIIKLSEHEVKLVDTVSGLEVSYLIVPGPLAVILQIRMDDIVISNDYETFSVGSA